MTDKTKPIGLEKRELISEGIEIRETDDGKRTIAGYAVKWEKKSATLGYWYRYKEQFKKGAFEDSLKNDDIRALWSHDTSQVLGRTKNSTLRLQEDDIGLRFELDLPDTTLGEDAFKTIKRGDVDGVSFGFMKTKDEWDETDPDNIIRTILTAKLYEISPVAFPAYPDSEVSTRADDPYKEYLDIKQKNSMYKQENRKKLLNIKLKEVM